MKHVQICRYTGKLEQETPYSTEVTLQEKKFESNDTGIAHIFPNSELVFVESVDTTVRYSGIPLPVSRLVSNINVIYEIHRKLGVSNLEEFCVIPPSGFIYDVLEEEPDRIETVLSSATYPISKAVYSINGNTLQIENDTIRCSNEFNLEPVFELYDSTLSKNE